MYELEASERALIVVADPPDPDYVEWNTEELRQLVQSAGARVVGEFHQKRLKPDPAYYIGPGKAEELYGELQELRATTVVVGDDLTPLQQKNLSDVTTIRVVDRTQLILDIFAQRAHTKEGKLQVELAQLNYMLPRLTGRGLEMSRLGGGIGTRGPGETKLETDRRHIRSRISDLEKELKEVRQHREVQKAVRRKLPFPSAALVGYTSAGKSTLLNTLSGAEVLVDAKLFATLDPTTRRVVLPDGWAVLMTDTVGFIRELPHHLIAAFRSTLEEVVDADFLIHVVDASHPQREQQQSAVEDVLEELGAGDKPVLTVFNKADLVKDHYELRHLVANTPNSLYMSAASREGIPSLMTQIIRVIKSLLVHVRLELPYTRSDIVAMCYENGRVISVDYQSDKIILDAQVTCDLAGKLQRYSVDDAAEDTD